MNHRDTLHFWQTPAVPLTPAQPWEFIKFGNCAVPPIETEAGWLVWSHGVGAMRKYCRGAFLIELPDPTRRLPPGNVYRLGDTPRW